MNDAIRAALTQGGLIDLTTTGRRTGEPRRVEIVFHAIDGRIVISGMPRREKRAWLANIEADPRVTIHLKRDVVADLPGAARVVTDEAERRFQEELGVTTEPLRSPLAAPGENNAGLLGYLRSIARNN